MVEMHAAWFCSSGSTLKPCLSTFTSGLAPLVFRPSVPIQLRKGYSLPPNQTPRVLPLKSFDVATPLDFLHVSIIPERLKICAMLTIGTPFSRAASALGIHSSVHTGASQINSIQI